MKSPLLLALAGTLVLLPASPLLAQDAARVAPKLPRTVIGLAPTGLYNKVRIKFERLLIPNLSLGATATYYYREYPGYQISPFARYYFEGIAPEGIYFQAQAAFFDQTSSKSKDKQGVSRFAGTGFGIGLGNQWYFEQSERFTIDTMIGYKVYDFNEKPAEGDPKDNDWYNLLSPGSRFNGMLSVGYAF